MSGYSENFDERNVYWRAGCGANVRVVSGDCCGLSVNCEGGVNWSGMSVKCAVDCGRTRNVHYANNVLVRVERRLPWRAQAGRIWPKIWTELYYPLQCLSHSHLHWYPQNLKENSWHDSQHSQTQTYSHCSQPQFAQEGRFYETSAATRNSQRVYYSPYDWVWIIRPHTRHYPDWIHLRMVRRATEIVANCSPPTPYPG